MKVSEVVGIKLNQGVTGTDKNISEGDWNKEDLIFNQLGFLSPYIHTFIKKKKGHDQLLISSYAHLYY